MKSRGKMFDHIQKNSLNIHTIFLHSLPSTTFSTTIYFLFNYHLLPFPLPSTSFSTTIYFLFHYHLLPFPLPSTSFSTTIYFLFHYHILPFPLPSTSFSTTIYCPFPLPLAIPINSQSYINNNTLLYCSLLYLLLLYQSNN